MEQVEFEQRRRAELTLRSEFYCSLPIDIEQLNAVLFPLLLKHIEQESGGKYRLYADRKGKDGCYNAHNPVRHWKIEMPKSWLSSNYVGEIVPEKRFDDTVRIHFYIVDPHWEILEKAVGLIVTDLEYSLGEISREIERNSLGKRLSSPPKQEYNFYVGRNIVGSEIVSYQGEIMSDTVDMSGDFRGAIVNVKSPLSHVRQSINTTFNADTATKDELYKLIEQLEKELQVVPSERGEEAEAVAESAKLLLETVNKDKPNKVMVQVSAEGLKQAAKNLAAITPMVLAIVTQIIETVMRITG